MKRVLIVDDSQFMRLSMKAMLERNGFEVVGEAQNGKIAVQKYQELCPELVTMDITMPEMDGLEALSAIRKLDPSCKILMISAVGQETNVRRAILEGAKNFIVKPYKEEKVIDILNKL